MSACHLDHSGWQPAKVNRVKCGGVALLSPSTGAACLLNCECAQLRHVNVDNQLKQSKIWNFVQKKQNNLMQFLTVFSFLTQIDKL